MSCRDIVKFHEVCHFWVGLDFFSSLRGLSPGRAVSRWSSSSSFSRVTPVFGRMASFFVADEALAISDMLCSITRGEIDFVYVHGVRVDLWGSASWGNVTVPPSSKSSKSYHISIELPGLAQPLFPFPSGLSIWEVLRGLRNLISSSAHSGVVRRHVKCSDT